MKIAEMNNCIEQMREIYKFDDEKTEIQLGGFRDFEEQDKVRLYTKDENGTEISLARNIEPIADLPSLEE